MALPAVPSWVPALARGTPVPQAPDGAGRGAGGGESRGQSRPGLREGPWADSRGPRTLTMGWQELGCPAPMPPACVGTTPAPPPGPPPSCVLSLPA